jgi:hypothetical protein
MMDQSNENESGAGQGTASIPNLQGSISLNATGGSHSANQVGQSPASVDWTQGSTPVASAQFSLAHMARIPMPPPPQVTDLTAGENSIPIFGDFSSASVSWTYGGDSGAATFAWGMGGLPVGPSGSTYVSEAVGPQKGNFQIAFADAPTSCLLSFQVNPSQAFIGPQLVLVYVDGEYVGALADGTSVVIEGKSLTLAVDFRAESFTDLQVGYTLQYQW